MVGGNFVGGSTPVNMCMQHLELLEPDMSFYKGLLSSSSILVGIVGHIGVKVVCKFALLPMRTDKRIASDFGIESYEELGNQLAASRVELGKLAELVESSPSFEFGQAYGGVFQGESGWFKQRAVDLLANATKVARQKVDECTVALKPVTYEHLIDHDDGIKTAELVALAKSKAARHLMRVWQDCRAFADKVHAFISIVQDDGGDTMNEAEKQADVSPRDAFAKAVDAFSETYGQGMLDCHQAVGVCSASQALFGTGSVQLAALAKVKDFLAANGIVLPAKLGFALGSKWEALQQEAAKPAPKA